VLLIWKLDWGWASSRGKRGCDGRDAEQHTKSRYDNSVVQSSSSILVVATVGIGKSRQHRCEGNQSSWPLSARSQGKTLWVYRIVAV